jgi:hypothetical protein
MRKGIDPPPSPSQSSRTGIARLTALLDDPDNQKQGNRSAKENDACYARREIKRDDHIPTTKRKGSFTRVAKDRQSQPIPYGSEGYEYSEDIPLENAREINQSRGEVTADEDYYEDLTISSHSSHDTVSTEGKMIQQYKEQLSGRRFKLYEKRVARDEDDSSNDPLRQFEKDMAGLDLKMTMVTDDSNDSENDLEQQPPYDPTTYQKLLGPIGPSRKINWKKSMYFLPCLLVLIGFVFVTPLVTDSRKEESSAELVEESSIQPTVAPPSPSPSRIEEPTRAPSKFVPSTLAPTRTPSFTIAPTQSNSTIEPNQCSAAEFPDSELDLIFLPSYVSVNYCAVPPEQLATFERLECVGVEYEYRPAGFIPNRFRDTDGR